MSNIPFQTTDWHTLAAVSKRGETGTAHYRTLQLEGLRIRHVEYSPGYKADHWCSKGHIVYCLEGELTSTLADGRSFGLMKGMSYVVSDEMSEHKSATIGGAKLLIIDGDFLQSITSYEPTA